MTTTPEAAQGRITGHVGPTAGVGPAPQATVLSQTTGTIGGGGGTVLLNAPSAGAYTLQPPLPNAVSLVIAANTAFAHVVTGSFEGGRYTTATFGGAVGDLLELMATIAGDGWTVDSLNGVTLS